MSELHPILAQKGVQPGTVDAFIEVAKYYRNIHYTEQPKNSNNSLFGAWYGLNGVAWCAMFVSYCLNKSGNGSAINGAQSKKGYALCSKGIAWFQKKHAWHPVMDAQRGDVAFFDWDHNHSPDHTGIIVKVDKKNKRVWTIEGNTGPANLSNGGAVLGQWRNMSVIIGVGRPVFANAVVAPATLKPVPAPVAPAPAPVVTIDPVKPVAPAPAPAKPAAKPTLKVGSKGASVKTLQTKLGVTADGDFGPKTKAAVVAFQKKHGLVADGVVGASTWAALK